MKPSNQRDNRQRNSSKGNYGRQGQYNNRWNRSQAQNRQEQAQKFYKTANMYSIFHKEYFENGPDFPDYDLYDLIKRSLNKDNTVESDFEKLFKSRNQQLSEFKFDLTTTPLGDFTEVVGYQNIQLKTTYPGLLIGTGYPHGFSAKGALKASLQFDYVTGLPHVPGSSLKGILRSGFPLSVEELVANKKLSEAEYSALEHANQMKFEYVRSILAHMTDPEIMELRDLIFGEFDWTNKSVEKLTYQPSDVFLGGFPSTQKEDLKLLELEYITPHDKEGFKNPTPIPLLKVRPGIVFEFGFILKDTKLQSGTTISVADKMKLFTQILEDFGVGAKTNVGFGQLVKA